MINNNLPKVFVGVPTARLFPYDDEGFNDFFLKDHKSPVALEITKGIGIGIDCQSIVVGHGNEDKIEIVGHPEDRYSPERSYTVERDGDRTIVNGYDFREGRLIEKKGNETEINGYDSQNNCKLDTFDNCKVLENQSGIYVQGRYPDMKYKITFNGREASLEHNFNYKQIPIHDKELSTEGNVTFMNNYGFGQSGHSFIVTREPNHMKVEGKYASQKFDITWDDKQIKIEGFRLKQGVTIKFK